jgi:hypothetical protein
MRSRMKLRKKQNGMTLIGALMVMSIIGFMFYVGIKVGPVYSEYYTVVKAMDIVASEPGVGNKSPAVIKDMMGKHFYSSYVERAKVSDIKITRNRGKKMVIAYVVQEPFIGNIDLLLKFENSVDLN